MSKPKPTMKRWVVEVVEIHRAPRTYLIEARTHTEAHKKAKRGDVLKSIGGTYDVNQRWVHTVELYE